MINQDKINWDATEDDEEEGYRIDDIEDGQVIEDKKPQRRSNDVYARPQGNRRNDKGNQGKN
eukprot:CAMPEP_0176371630 /NCGR_PEP_ID=MMETSP0126-20121128/24831_1 /TAXON_ID=141414 ORGANISM="Strombidinopsis acuminatum, Strain SPMC142" /NCGR_SAMPLE_ID=MMETSP0126 /ASSEMBLY_ACC=CAM_ASM_000229 /LENGTH=61 /DNA_ID=CAMNT_0017731161 /DNA_START=2143 /DNA_END=2328 /DNA_ORIENTATION=+